MGVRLGARTTVVQLPGGSVTILGPGRFSDEEARAIDALGPVRALVAPNLMHHLFLGPARDRWRDAQLVAPAALAKKRADLKIDLPIDGSGSAASLPADGSGVLEPTFVGGMPGVDEIAWRHAPSRTLVLSDLCFNVRRVRLAPGHAGRGAGGLTGATCGRGDGRPRSGAEAAARPTRTRPPGAAARSGSPAASPPAASRPTL